MNQDISSERGWMLINNVIYNNLLDEDILERVNKYHGEKQRENVNNRINTLAYFFFGKF